MYSNRFYLPVILLLVLIIFGLITCNSCKNAKISELENRPAGVVVNTVITHDTAHIRDSFRSVVYRPAPYAVIQSRVDSFTAFESLPVDTAFILRDYAAKVVYKDSQSTQYGKVYINDTISRNRILTRNVKTDFSIPVITNTITNTVAEPKKVKLYLVGTFQGSITDPLQAAGAGLMFQFKSDNAIEAQTLFNRDNVLAGIRNQTFQISYKHKISLH